MDQLKSTSLVAAMVAGDNAPAAFEEILASSRMRLFRVALLLLGSREEAEDATQRTLLRALESRSRFRGDAGVYTWLYRILHNHVKDLWKQRARAGQLLVPAGDLRLNQIGEHRPDAEAELRGRERDQAVRRALGELDARAREVLVLRHYEEMSYEQIAAVLAVPIGTVRSRLSAARERMRERLSREEALR